MPSYPASASQFLGQTIDNGALRIEVILGAGSFGVVYRAVDTKTGVQYAVKRVKKEGNEIIKLARDRSMPMSRPTPTFSPSIVKSTRAVTPSTYTIFAPAIFTRS